VENDTDLSVDALRGLVDRFKSFYDFPGDAREQLARASGRYFILDR
jgi:hypothetical protein